MIHKRFKVKHLHKVKKIKKTFLSDRHNHERNLESKV